MKYLIKIKLINNQVLCQQTNSIEQAQVLIEHFLKWDMVKEVQIKKKIRMPSLEALVTKIAIG